MTIAAALLLVADEPVGDRDLRLLWAGLLLVAGLLVAAVLIAVLDRWRRRMLESEPSDLDTLGSFRLSYERGELSEAEYRDQGAVGWCETADSGTTGTSAGLPGGSPAEGRTPDPPTAE